MTASSLTAARGRGRAASVRIAAPSTLVTAAVFVPQLATDPGDVARSLNVVWLLVLLSAAPVAAAVLSRRALSAPDPQRLALVAVPQLLVTVGLTRLDTWLEVRSGYLLPGSSEEAMSYGFGFVFSVLIGLGLVALVALGVRYGSRRRGPSSG